MNLHPLTNKNSKSSIIPASILVFRPLDRKIFNKILSLHNKLVHHYNISYKEVLIQYRDKNTKNTKHTYVSSIYYKPMINKYKPSPLEASIEILRVYLKKGIISKKDMAFANKMWKQLLKSK